MDRAFADRYLNEGFSGGEKKRNEILQMAILEPELAVLDETDSGLDIDALRRSWPTGSHEVRADRPELGRARHHPLPAPARRSSTPDVVHILSTAASSARGGPELAERLEERGLRRVHAEDRARPALRPRSTSPPSRRTSRSSAEVNGTRSSTSTRPPRRRSRARCSTRWTRYYETHQRQRPPRRLPHRRGGHRRRSRRRARQGRAASSAPARPHEIVFTKNATEAINLVAYTWGRANLRAGDAIVLTEMEHHANIVPWQMLAAERGIELRWMPVDRRRPARPRRPRHLLDGAKLARRHRHVQRARHDQPGRRDRRRSPTPHGALVLVDACQSVPHLPIDVAASGCDFLAFTAHKMLGPTGIGVLCGPAGAAGGDAAVPGRRRDDPRRPPRRLDLERHPVEVRGRHPADRRGRRAWAPPSTTSRRSAWTPCGPTRSI